jgi:redox-sensitive bicupin YhaK (pirin superfamily)
MSWQPAEDPKPGDKRACDAIETVIVPRARDLGGFEVRRALPSARRQMVGPFIFWDQMGPAEFVIGEGIDVRPHPHIGLATVTYLFEGEIVHRDSLGTLETIRPGALNLMTSGKGIVHSERTGQAARTAGAKLFGIQSWVALPRSHEEGEPAFLHYAERDTSHRRRPGRHGPADPRPSFRRRVAGEDADGDALCRRKPRRGGVRAL